MTVRQVQPDGPQDLFVGQDLTLFVRYRGAGPTTLTFEGETPNGRIEGSERVTLPDRSRENAFVAKLWAVQRVGWLSAERRRTGPNTELDNELRDDTFGLSMGKENSDVSSAQGLRDLENVRSFLAGPGRGRCRRL